MISKSSSDLTDGAIRDTGSQNHTGNGVSIPEPALLFFRSWLSTAQLIEAIGRLLLDQLAAILRHVAG